MMSSCICIELGFWFTRSSCIKGILNTPLVMMKYTCMYIQSISTLRAVHSAYSPKTTCLEFSTNFAV